AARQESKPDGRTDPAGYGEHLVPLHDLLPYSSRHQARRKGDRMTPFNNASVESHLVEGAAGTTRREFLKNSGRLVVGFSALSAMPGVPLAEAVLNAAQGVGPYPDPDFRQLDSWIVIRQ